MAEVARLKRKAEVRLVSIPGDWYPPVGRNFREGDHEQFGRPGRKDRLGSGELEQRIPDVLTEVDAGRIADVTFLILISDLSTRKACL
jgi:hypothetical protein